MGAVRIAMAPSGHDSSRGNRPTLPRSEPVSPVAEADPGQAKYRVAAGGGISLAANIASRAASLGIHVLLGRLLGVSSYGVYMIGYSVVGVLQSFASLGLQTGIVRFGSIHASRREISRLKSVFITGNRLSLLGSIVVGVSLWMSAPWLANSVFHEPDLATALRLFVVAMPGYVLAGTLAACVQAVGRIELFQSINVCRSAAFLLLLVPVCALGWGLKGAVAAYAVTGWVSATLGFTLLQRTVPSVSFARTLTYPVARLLRFSVPTFLAGFSYLLLMYTDRLMLGYYGRSVDVGVYGAASTLSGLLTIFLVAAIPAAAPYLSALHEAGEEQELARLYTTVTRWVVMTTLPLFIVVFVAPESVMAVFGPDFRVGSTCLRILALGQLVNAGTGPIGSLMEMTGHQDINLVAGVVLVCTNIFVNALLIPRYGMVGAAAATATTNSAIFLVLLGLACKLLRLRFGPISTWAPIGWAAVAMSCAFVLKSVFSINSMICLFLSVLMYVVVVLRVVISSKDYKALTVFISKVVNVR